MNTPIVKRGFTLVELLLALALSTLIIRQVLFTTRSAGQVIGSEPPRMMLENQARLVLDRISLALMGASRESLVPLIENEHTSGMTYRVTLGYQDGEVVWGDPEEIRLEGNSQIVWTTTPPGGVERRVVWCSFVRDLLEGELLNELDDNGNGLTDEDGLSFLLQGDTITVRLSLSDPSGEGPDIEESVEVIVACRN